MGKQICKIRNESSAVTKVKKADFHLNEPVFAKMNGYPSWPGFICEIGRTIKVFFFGTKNRSVCIVYCMLIAHVFNSFILNTLNAYYVLNELDILIGFPNHNDPFSFTSGTVPMKSITKLLSDDCRKIVDENANKIGFSKAFEEMRISIMPKPLRYHTRSSRRRVHLSPGQVKMETLSEIYEAARFANERDQNKKKTNERVRSTTRKDNSKLVVVERSCKSNERNCMPSRSNYANALDDSRKKRFERTKTNSDNHDAPLRRSERVAARRSTV